MAKFTNHCHVEVCWRGIVVPPGQTVTDKTDKNDTKKKIKEVIDNGN